MATDLRIGKIMAKKPKPMTFRQYETKRDWLIDTAETPEDKARLKEDLKKLRQQYKASRREGGITTPNGVNNVNPLYRNFGR